MSRMLLILGLFVGAGLAGCGNDGPAGLEVSCEEAAELGEELAPSLTFENGGAEFEFGEPIRFNVSVTNCTDGRVVMRYPSSQRYDFTVSTGRSTLASSGGGQKGRYSRRA